MAALRCPRSVLVIGANRIVMSLAPNAVLGKGNDVTVVVLITSDCNVVAPHKS